VSVDLPCRGWLSTLTAETGHSLKNAPRSAFAVSADERLAKILTFNPNQREMRHR
jgi:hypothetical protein